MGPQRETLRFTCIGEAMTIIRKKTLSGLFLTLSPSYAFAAGGGAKIINYFEIFLQDGLGLDAHTTHDWMPVIGGGLSFLVLCLLGFAYKRGVEGASNPEVPPDKFSVRAGVEMIMDMLHSMSKNLIGEKGPNFLPLLASLFLFIFVSNLSGLIPGLYPATDSISTNLVMGLLVFLIYNVAGFKEHGPSYLKQFLGPVFLLIPLMVVIELIGHAARPLSLSLRLYGNIFGDHLVLSVFTGLTVLIFPAFLLFFGLLVASLQSFVFTLLSGIYIALAMSHDH